MRCEGDRIFFVVSGAVTAIFRPILLGLGAAVLSFISSTTVAISEQKPERCIVH